LIPDWSYGDLEEYVESGLDDDSQERRIHL
jgi:hypothetical protein